MITAMHELKRMIELMTQNGGYYDLFCVLGLIEDRFLNEENVNAEKYAEFCVMCDRNNLPLINFKDWVKQINNN